MDAELISRAGREKEREKRSRPLVEGMHLQHTKSDPITSLIIEVSQFLHGAAPLFNFVFRSANNREPAN